MRVEELEAPSPEELAELILESTSCVGPGLGSRLGGPFRGTGYLAHHFLR